MAKEQTDCIRDKFLSSTMLHAFPMQPLRKLSCCLSPPCGSTVLSVIMLKVLFFQCELNVTSSTENPKLSCRGRCSGPAPSVLFLISVGLRYVKDSCEGFSWFGQSFSTLPGQVRCQTQQLCRYLDCLRHSSHLLWINYLFVRWRGEFCCRLVALSIKPCIEGIQDIGKRSVCFTQYSFWFVVCEWLRISPHALSVLGVLKASPASSGHGHILLF